MDFHALFPVKENSRWVYKTDRGNVTLEVAERQVVGGKNFYIVETRVDNQVLQREKYLVDVDSFWLISRSFGEQNYLYDPPNPILVAPPEVGRSWDWKGNCGGQTLEFYFSFTDKSVVRVPAGTFAAIKIEIEERGPLGTSRTARWYSQGVGMIAESSASDLMQFEAQLESYQIG